VGGWGFGLTDPERRPKPALDVVARWAARDVRGQRERWPSVTAVVCVRNGEPYIGDCLASLARLDYPDLEVIVCDDGSDDETVSIVSGFPFRLLRLAPGGLSRARNVGAAAATGEIVAFLDADARCHPHWPYFLALSLEDEGVAATGGPNLPCPEAGLIERAVTASPGNPTEVLVGHDRAEHVPGCNMAVRREALAEIGGFDPVYTAAGDDVDVCWKLIDRGGEIAFAPAAQVLHHRRATIRAFLRQQVGYGRAEALLAARHRHRFNRLGQARWSGFVYGGVGLLESLLRPLVYHGPSGTAPFQPVIRRRAESAHAWVQSRLPLAAAALPPALLATASPWWLLVPGAIVLLVLAHATATAVGVRGRRDEAHPFAFRALVALLHIVQPLVRAGARALHGLRQEAAAEPSARPPWSGDRYAWLAALRRELAARRCTVLSGGPHADWDVAVNRGPLVRARIATAVAWGWEPLAAVRVRLRAPAYAVAGAAGALALLQPLPALVLLVLLVVAAGLEWGALRRVVTAALTRTSGRLGAPATEPDPRARLAGRIGPRTDVSEETA
jgi:O-antigen biosynthesis protein